MYDSSESKISGKKGRHEKALEKYKNYEISRLNKNTLQELIKGEKQEVTVPKSGEFVVISTDTKIDKAKILDIPILELLDGTKTFSELKNKQVSTNISRLNTPWNFKKPQSRRINLNPMEKVEDKELDDEKLDIIQDDNKGRHPIEDEYHTRLTNDLKMILKRQQQGLLSASNLVINNMVETKVANDSHSPEYLKSRIQTGISTISKNVSLPTLARPFSAKFLLDNMGGTEADPDINEEMKKARIKGSANVRIRKVKNTYQVQAPYTGRPPHIQGFNTIKDKNLLTQKELEELSKPKPKPIISPYLVGEDTMKQTKKGQTGFDDYKNDPKPAFFLPLEYYDVDDDDNNPEILMEKYKGPYDNKTYGYSKWYLNDGTFKWQKCEVVDYNYKTERFIIKWLHNGNLKEVPKVNLRFELENEELFNKKLKESENYRMLSEIFMKYNGMIEAMTNSTHELQIDILERINFLVAGFPFRLSHIRDPIEFKNLDPNLKFNAKRYLMPKMLDLTSKNYTEVFQTKKYSLNQHSDLQNEVKKLYVRANHQIEFDNTLPYSDERQKYFRGILPDELFIPLYKKATKETNDVGNIQIPYESQNQFLMNFALMKKKLHQANPEKLKVLLTLNEELLKFETMHMVADKFVGQLELPDFLKQQENASGDFIRELRGKMFDSYYEINRMVEWELENLKKRNEEKMRKLVTEAERRAAEEKELPPDINTSLKSFQSLVNMLYERSTRMCFERSMNLLLKQLKFLINRYNSAFENKPEKYLNILTKNNIDYEDVLIYQQHILYDNPKPGIPVLKAKLAYNDHKEFFLNPSINLFNEKIKLFARNFKSKLTTIECLKAKEIGPARSSGFLDIILEKDPFFEMILKQIQDSITLLLRLPEVLLEKMSEFKSLIEINAEKVKSKLKKMTFDDFKKELFGLKKINDELERVLFKNQIKTGLLIIDVQYVKESFQAKIKELSSIYYEVLIFKISQENTKLAEETEEILKKLKTHPTNIEELHEQRIFADGLINHLKTVTYPKINEIMNKLNLLEEMKYKISYEDFAKSWSSAGLPLRIMHKRERCLTKLQTREKKFSEDLTVQQAQITAEIQDLNLELDRLMKASEYEKYDQYAVEFAQIGERIEKAQREGELINKRENILKWKTTDCSEIEKIKKAFIPYNRVWSLAREYHIKMPSILNSPFITIDKDQLTNEITDAWNELFQLEKKEFKTVIHMYKVTVIVRKLYEDFRPYLPLINDLRNPALRPRHWSEISEITKVEMDQEMPHSLKYLLVEKNIMKYKDQINDISELATKQQSFEKLLYKMKTDWKTIRFELLEYRDTQTYILKALDPILDKIDEDLTKTMSISSSPFVKFLENEVNQWKINLIKCQDVIDIWIKVQKLWRYLQPIFFSEDIIHQMPKEGTKYATADRLWRGIMENTVKYPNVMETCNSGKIKDQFQMALDLLEQVIKGLNDYLNTKRAAFPRFYFLSNDELLSILSQTKEPKAVQKQLNKCFEGIEYLTFQENLEITHMNSSENEAIAFSKAINPLDKDNQARFVEEWLSDVEKGMKISLKEIFFAALNDYSKKDRKEWLFSWPAQIIVACDQTIWTSFVTEAIIKNTEKVNESSNLGTSFIKNKSLTECFTKQNNLLIEIVRLLRTNISKKDRITLGVLIVIEVHAKDVIEELIASDVKSPSAFEWLAQMRYCIEKDNLIVHMLNTQRKYGFEYLGNQTRLVITPLTDRCYRTLMSALQMNLGGAPEGPAGTGKTETTKDLAKALAKHCVVFNCSEGLDYQAMGKFFRGLCSCGSWACFDEFNRIELEVLSVIAQQILQIQTALIRDSQREIKSFTFEGISCPMDSSCAIFITMNPGYAGRTELPDNLKALFRPVAMMIPDYSMIAEILLYSYGYEKARELSIKITSCLKLSSEQLSSQSHYDFGMRAVKAILSAAGTLKRQYPEENESILILRAISECNVPKFTSSDVPLFLAILSDLFPNIKSEEKNSGGLPQCIKETAEKLNYTFTKKFETKIIELYETIQVRHGLMIVGATLSGKSSIIHTLSQAIQEWTAQSETPMKVKLYPLNPKSVTYSLLYGAIDNASNEWHDGIIADIFRTCKDDKFVEDLKWILFDGPVDAVWIESLNTVLDDNKKLCLTNGETIKLTDKMSILFEVEDLLEASPATVSRCGMVYLENTHLEWTSLYNKWKKSMPPPLMTNEHEIFLDAMVDEFLIPTIKFLYAEINNTMKFLMNFNQTQTIDMFLRLLESYILKKRTKEQIILQYELEKQKVEARLAAQKLEGIDVKNIANQNSKKTFTIKDKALIYAAFIQAAASSLSPILDEICQVEFSNFIKNLAQSFFTSKKDKQELFKDLPKEVILPEEPHITEIYYDIEKKLWVAYSRGMIDFKLPANSKFHEVYIPTVESLRYTNILYELITHNFPILFYGKTGTGKTIMIKKLLLNELDSSCYIPTITVFSANTTASNAQDILESKIEKQKRRKGVYGPIVGYTNIIFIDDLNMPTKDKYGSQPPLELIRQWFDYKSWYDRKTLEYKNIVDIQFISAMGTGRAAISNRLIRHFNMLYIPEMGYETLTLIIKKTLDWGFNNHVDKVKFLIQGISKICIGIYKQIQHRKEFLPLPKKSHYLFNMRDLMKLVQGILAVPANRYEATGDNKRKILRLLVNEAQCVFSDRMIDIDDKKAFMDALDECIYNEYSIKIEEIYDEKQPYYGNFMEMHSIEKYYDEIMDEDKLITKINEYVDEFNSLYRLKRIDIVLFKEALQLLNKINRIISNPFGNALLIGVGGSGRHTMSRLACYMQDYLLMELETDKELNSMEWYEFIKKILRTTGVENKQVVFLVSDSQLHDSKFYEDLNNLLNIGEIPNLYTLDEKEAIFGDLKELIQKDKKNISQTPLALWEYFVNNCKINLHIVICMSPIGDKLRITLRNFPSLVSCTSVIWILPWNESALYAVAIHYMENAHKLEMDDKTRTSISKICVNFHLSVANACIKFKNELNRSYYVTPISYIQLLDNIERLLIKKQEEMLNNIKKYENGVKKLLECSQSVENMKTELEALKPILVLKEKETEEIMKNVQVESAEAEKQKAIVIADEEITTSKAEAASAIQTKCQERLAEALPQLEEALAALKTLKESDFVEIKTMQKPPLMIRKTMAAVCIMRGKFCNDDKAYWEEAKKQLAEPKKYKEKLENFNKDSVTDKILNKIEQFLRDNPEFKPENIKNTSAAAVGICKWVRAMYNYNIVSRSIQPLREDLKLANQSLEEAHAELKKKRELLAEVEARCQELKDKFDQSNFEKQSLKAQKTDCEVKLDRALKLTKGLGSENERWTAEAQKLKNELKRLLGDIIVSVGYMSYLGAFTGKYRSMIINECWIPKFDEENIIVSRPEDYSLAKVLGNPIVIQDWILNGLPLDTISIDNGVIMSESSLWPLIIDPQKQATKFIKNREMKTGQKTWFTKPSKDFAKVLENVIRLGCVLFVENIGETIDPILEPILTKSFYTKGGTIFINVGNNAVEFNDKFKLYLFTNLNNPHYTPDILTKVCLLNFCITEEGLKDQMLSIIAREEEPKDEDEKLRLMYETADYKTRKKMLEDKILELLEKSEGAVLDNEQLVNSLTESKTTSEDIENKLKTAKITEDRINSNRLVYESVSIRATSLYLMILQLSSLDPMYQYSLEWFIKHCLKTIRTTEKSPVKNTATIKQRVINLCDALVKDIYREVSRSLFEKHKLIFTFLLAITILQIQGVFDPLEWKILLTGISQKPLETLSNPDPNTFSQTLWEAIFYLTSIDYFKDLPNHIIDNIDLWKEWYNNIENEKLPEIYDNEGMTPMRKLLFYKTFRADLFITKLKDFIAQVLNPSFNETQIFTLDDSFKESITPYSPLIFILSPGDDPQDELKKFAHEKNSTLTIISLGKGQGDYAARTIRECMQAGSWILLQNCHLAVSWLKNLEEIVEEMQAESNPIKVNGHFRLWLTTATTDIFPISLLQNGIKMTKDPPRGIKSNIMQIYKNMNSTKAERDFFNSCEKAEEWRKLFMGLTFFHAIIRERKRYGSIGWNIVYDFNESDFKISMRLLHNILNKYPEIPFPALNYLTGECYYGGRVTDDWDRRVLMTILKDFYVPYTLYDDYRFAPAIKEYYIPDKLGNEDDGITTINILEESIQFINSLPEIDNPELYGLHPNASISSNIAESNTILGLILEITPQSILDNQDERTKKMLNQANELKTIIPDVIDVHSILQKYPISYYESMNAVLLQEVLRYNVLLEVIHSSLEELIESLQGFIVFSADIERVSESIIKNLVPQKWLNRSFSSLKSLVGYLKDLNKRVNMFKKWIEEGQPKIFWISGFFFPQSFLTGISQNYSRANTIPIDKLSFDFIVMKSNQEIMNFPSKGCYIDGLYLEGASWNDTDGALDEPVYKVLYKETPVIWLIPTEEKKDYDNSPNIYTCPLYKTSERRGVLTTTGHSSNFILPVYLPSLVPKEHWIKRGTALLTQLND